MKYFHGKNRTKKYFEGWYIKHQKGDQVLSFIPAFHVDEEGNPSTSLQIITSEGSYCISYPIETFCAEEKEFSCHLGGNVFAEKGCLVDIQTEEICIKGHVTYQKLLPLKAEIMGPFKHVPRMQCNHGVISQTHVLTGEFVVNGEIIDFTDGLGYIETDWGSSFPKEYLWTQCSFFEKGPANIMVALAHVPVGKWAFAGCIGSIYYEGQEYRLATYLGARYRMTETGMVVICQGRYRLQFKIKQKQGHALKAPQDGGMSRQVREALTCKVQYQFFIDQELILDHKDQWASVENALTQSD